MRTTLFGLVCALAACGDNYDYDTAIDAPRNEDAGVDADIDAVGSDAPSQAQIPLPTPYLSREDSPFKNLPTWHVEDFEDHMLDDVPGVTDNGGVNKASVSAPPIVDSVDNDDNVIDGACTNCDSWYSSGGELRFTFSGPEFPTHAGVVWTDGVSGVTVTFEAFDAQGNSLGSTSLPNHADGSNLGTTAEDRFFSVISQGGVGSLVIKNPGAIEVDHLQWGR